MSAIEFVLRIVFYIFLVSMGVLWIEHIFARMLDVYFSKYKEFLRDLTDSHLRDIRPPAGPNMN